MDLGFQIARRVRRWRRHRRSPRQSSHTHKRVCLLWLRGRRAVAHSQQHCCALCVFLAPPTTHVHGTLVAPPTTHVHFSPWRMSMRMCLHHRRVVQRSVRLHHRRVVQRSVRMHHRRVVQRSVRLHRGGMGQSSVRLTSARGAAPMRRRRVRGLVARKLIRHTRELLCSKATAGRRCSSGRFAAVVSEVATWHWQLRLQRRLQQQLRVAASASAVAAMRAVWLPGGQPTAGHVMRRVGQQQRRWLGRVAHTGGRRHTVPTANLGPPVDSKARGAPPCVSSVRQAADAYSSNGDARVAAAAADVCAPPSRSAAGGRIGASAACSPDDVYVSAGDASRARTVDGPSDVPARAAAAATAARAATTAADDAGDIAADDAGDMSSCGGRGVVRTGGSQQAPKRWPSERARHPDAQLPASRRPIAAAGPVAAALAGAAAAAPPRQTHHPPARRWRGLQSPAATVLPSQHCRAQRLRRPSGWWQARAAARAGAAPPVYRGRVSAPAAAGGRTPRQQVTPEAPAPSASPARHLNQQMATTATRQAAAPAHEPRTPARHLNRQMATAVKSRPARLTTETHRQGSRDAEATDRLRR
eukprot:355090-Chlamydomonas_euryale.AAC.1